MSGIVIRVESTEIDAQYSSSSLSPMAMAALLGDVWVFDWGGLSAVLSAVSSVVSSPSAASSANSPFLETDTRY